MSDGLVAAIDPPPEDTADQDYEFLADFAAQQAADGAAPEAAIVDLEAAGDPVDPAAAAAPEVADEATAPEVAEEAAPGLEEVAAGPEEAAAEPSISDPSDFAIS